MPVVSPQEGGPSGPAQTGRGCNGQYVYWIVMVQPTLVGWVDGVPAAAYLHFRSLTGFVSQLEKNVTA